MSELLDLLWAKLCAFYRYALANPFNTAFGAVVGIVFLSIAASFVFSEADEEQEEPTLVEFREGDTSPSTPLGCVEIERILICPD